MEPRLLIGHRARFDLEADDRDDPAVGDIVLIRPPRGALTGGCGRPRSPRVGRLCVESRGGPAPGAIRFVTRVVALAGDNRMASEDSRFWGALPVDQVVGRFVRVIGTDG